MVSDVIVEGENILKENQAADQVYHSFFNEYLYNDYNIIL